MLLGALMRAWRGWRESVMRVALAELQETLMQRSSLASTQTSARIHGALRGLVRVAHSQVFPLCAFSHTVSKSYQLYPLYLIVLLIFIRMLPHVFPPAS